MPYKNIGYQGICGAALQAAYRTAIVATDKIPFTSENLIDEYIRLKSEWLDGHAGLKSNEQGPKMVKGSVNVDMVYDERNGDITPNEFVGTDLFLAAAMGNETWDAVNLSNQITLTDDVDAAITIAFLKGSVGTNLLWEFLGCKCGSFSLEGQSGQNSHIKGVFDWICYNLKRSSCVNTSTDLTTLPSAVPNRVLFGDGVFRIGVLGDALSTQQAVISKFSLKCNNNLVDTEFATIDDSGHTDDTLILESLRNGFREVTFNATLPRYNSEASGLQTYYQDNTPLQADLVFTNGTKKFILYLPHLVITKFNAPISGAEIIPVEIECSLMRGAAYNNGAGNTWMTFLDGSTTIAEEFAIETLNERTGAIL